MDGTKRLYLHEPEVIFKDGLAKVLTDINGNEFYADKRKKGSVLTIDYHHERGKGLRVADYEVAVDDFERKYWKETGKRHWVKNKDILICGAWENGW